MIPIQIDISEIADELDLTREEIRGMADYTVKEVTAEFARQWQEQAKKTLKQTRQRYVNSIIVVDEGIMKGAVVLAGKLPNMIESGVGAFDLKQGFKASPKTKTSKDGGWYLTVPFRTAASESLGESPMFTGRLPSEIHRIMKAKPMGQRSSMPLKPEEVPKKFREGGVRPGVTSLPTSQTFDQYQHKTGRFQGLVRIRDVETGQMRYMSFRRVSDKSDPNSWIHTGLLAYNLAEKALDETDIDTVADIAVDNFLNQIGF